MASLVKLNQLVLRNSILQIRKNIRVISTSEKKRETAASTIAPPKVDSPAATKNWVSWGFDFRDQAEDSSAAKGSFFFSVTLCLVWGTFIWSYLPDPQLRDWAQREGFLELRRREAAGLEPISRDYVNPSSVELPADEDLGKTEIII